MTAMKKTIEESTTFLLDPRALARMQYTGGPDGHGEIKDGSTIATRARDTWARRLGRETSISRTEHMRNLGAFWYHWDGEMKPAERTRCVFHFGRKDQDPNNPHGREGADGDEHAIIGEYDPLTVSEKKQVKPSFWSNPVISVLWGQRGHSHGSVWGGVGSNADGAGPDAVAKMR
jgi:hypothetical protein